MIYGQFASQNSSNLRYVIPDSRIRVLCGGQRLQTLESQMINLNFELILVEIDHRSWEQIFFFQKNLYIRIFSFNRILTFWPKGLLWLQISPKTNDDLYILFDPWNLFINYVLFLIETEMAQFFTYLKNLSRCV